MTLKTWSGRIATGVMLPCLLLAGVARGASPQEHAENAVSESQASLHIVSASFANDGIMPPKLTCDGPDLSPDIQLPTPPPGTKSFAIVMDDPDAPIKFTHWLAYNIPAGTRDIAEGASSPSKRLDHGAEGVNNFGNLGYGGPCPPVGRAHHYVLKVYALDVNPALPPGQNKQQLAAVLDGHVLAEGQITGLYARGG